MGDFGVVNTDLAFSGNHVFVGSYNGFQIWDISAAGNPRLRSSLVCPGGQGNVSVYRNLLFMSGVYASSTSATLTVRGRSPRFKPAGARTPTVS
jgi:hypothetical protein